MAMPCHWQQ